MFCITLIHRDGGHTSCTGLTAEDAKFSASSKLFYYAKSCIVATVPYEVFDGEFGDASMPDDIAASLGEEIMRIYKSESDR
jgi:hypothetical protein